MWLSSASIAALRRAWPQVTEALREISYSIALDQDTPSAFAPATQLPTAATPPLPPTPNLALPGAAPPVLLQLAAPDLPQGTAAAASQAVDAAAAPPPPPPHHPPTHAAALAPQLQQQSPHAADGLGLSSAPAAAAAADAYGRGALPALTPLDVTPLMEAAQQLPPAPPPHLVLLPPPQQAMEAGPQQFDGPAGGAWQADGAVPQQQRQQVSQQQWRPAGGGGGGDRGDEKGTWLLPQQQELPGGGGQGAMWTGGQPAQPPAAQPQPQLAPSPPRHPPWAVARPAPPLAPPPAAARDAAAAAAPSPPRPRPSLPPVQEHCVGSSHEVPTARAGTAPARPQLTVAVPSSSLVAPQAQPERRPPRHLDSPQHGGGGARNAGPDGWDGGGGGGGDAAAVVLLPSLPTTQLAKALSLPPLGPGGSWQERGDGGGARASAAGALGGVEGGGLVSACSALAPALRRGGGAA